MADNLVEIDLPTIQGMDEILKPSDRPVLGKQRLVRFALVEHFGNFPIVWTSPYTILATLKENEPAVPVHVLLLLISKGPPHPITALGYLTDGDLLKCKMAPVEW